MENIASIAKRTNGGVSRLIRVPMAPLILAIVLLLCSMAILSWLGVPLSPYSYDQTSDQILKEPSVAHPMGTDELGRDLLARVIFGSRLSLSIGLITAI